MRHRKSGLKLNRTASHRKAMFRNMVTSLFKHERIRTTDTKAKELRRWADHIITLAKRGDLHARRQALAIVTEKDVVHKLFETAAKRFGEINGGYTRIVKLGRRAGDAAPMSSIELVAAEDRKKTKKKKKAKAAAPKKADAKTGKATKKKADSEAEVKAKETEGTAKKTAKKKAAPKKEESEKKPAAKKKAAPKKEEEKKKPAAKKKAAPKKEEGEKKAAGGAKGTAKKAAAKKDDKKEKKEHT